MGKHAFRIASLECLAKSLLPCSTDWRFMACVLLAEAIQCTYDRKNGSYSAHMTGKTAATVYYFNKGLKLKLHVLMS